MKMLVTDLDNTLYDWVTFFAKAFDAMVTELSSLLGVERGQLLEEFRAVHQHYHNIEQPFAALELPSVLQHFGNLPRQELAKRLDGPFHTFNAVRKTELKLYPGVAETLSTLRAQGVLVVGFTEAMLENSYYRISRFGVADLFGRLYSLEGEYSGHPNPERSAQLAPPPGYVRAVPRAFRKPDPFALLSICRQEGISPFDTWYVGDSLAKDIAMAKNARIVAIWARYGTQYSSCLWDILVQATHWTPEDVRREENIRRLFGSVQPDYTVDSFPEILQIMKVGDEAQ